MDENRKNLLIGFMAFILEIVLFYYLWENNIILTISLILVSAFILIWFSSREEKILYFACFILGPLFDLLLVPRGVWSYANPTFYGVPLWLPIAYGLGTVVIVKIGNSISRMF